VVVIEKDSGSLQVFASFSPFVSFSPRPIPVQVPWLCRLGHAGIFDPFRSVGRYAFQPDFRSFWPVIVILVFCLAPHP